MTELAQPLAVRRAVAFAEAVFEGQHTVEGVLARRCTLDSVDEVLGQGEIPLLIDPEGTSIRSLAPSVVIDGIMAKRNTGTQITAAPLVIALGPGFTAGQDCHAVIETNRGHFLGRVIWDGAAQPDTGVPGPVTGVGVRHTRVLRAPADGHVEAHFAIGDRIEEGAMIAQVQPTGEGPAPVIAPFTGVLRGIIHPQVFVSAGTKIGDLDPRVSPEHCFTISDKSLAVAGGALEAILGVYFGHRSLPVE
jgi:xanthine dehydrogenase accessory factor